MMNVKIAAGPDSWGVWFPNDPSQIPWQRYLDEVVDAGYEFTELGPYGYLPTDLGTLRNELQKRNLKVPGSFAEKHLEDAEAWPEIEKEVSGVGRTLEALGGKFLVLIDEIYPHTFKRRTDSEAWKRLIESTHKAAHLARSFGLTTVFHPQADSHVEYEDQIEAFLEQTEPDLVLLCLDTGHHAYRNGDPVRFMRKHHRRIPYLHLKSVDREIQQKVDKEQIPFVQAVAMGIFCEPSRGAVDFIAFRDVLRDIQWSGWACVEQDMYPAPFDKPLPIAKRTRAYLHSIGLG